MHVITSRYHAARLAALVILTLAVPLPAPGASAAAAPRPAELVADLNAVILEVMRNAEDLGYEGRYDRLAPLLSETFNFPQMARISAGGHWRSLSPDQRAKLTRSFGRMSIGTFANRFDGYSGERFEVVGEEPGPRGTVLVRNRLIKKTGEPVEINYLMKQYDGRWRVIDVYLESKYSELAIKRSEYTSVIANEGFDSLIQRIDDKLAEWAGNS